jgi:hypothetical protein
LRCMFPDDFPNSPVQFTLRYPEVPPCAELHQYKNGALCLLEPDEWSPRLTALGLRARAVAWCFCLVHYMQTGRFEQPTRGRSRSQHNH